MKAILFLCCPVPGIFYQTNTCGKKDGAKHARENYGLDIFVRATAVHKHYAGIDETNNSEDGQYDPQDSLFHC